MRVLAAILLAGCLHAADEWPQFRGNPQLTGVATGAVPATLKLLWTYEAGDGIQSSAAIADGVVYVGVESADLLAIDLATGKLRWKYRAKDGIDESSPLVHDGVVYVGDIAGTLHAVRAADGKGLWTFKTDSEMRSSPVIDGDRLFIGSYDGNLYCLSVKDGKVLWKFTTSSYVHATPAIAGGLIYIAGCDEFFAGCALQTARKCSNSIPADTPARRLRCWASGRISAPSTTTWWEPI
jgi:outer membrane protein assembly factor BamB